uniref:Cap-specific mRNA (nucleoside-2'-O-)-methyltransferase 1 n=1 Tax=Pectinophora gossypiella TaxID=13191 RepID=A0A1E1WUV2_PECGO
MMNLSDPSADDDSSSDESPKASTPAKRPRSDTYGASSTTSHGSVLLESDEDQPETPVERSNNFNFRKQSTDGNLRLSRSSSSPTDQFDDIRPSFDDNDTDNGESSMRPSFQNSTSYTQFKEMESAFAGGYSEKSKRIMSNMGFKLGKGLGKYEHGRIEPVEASTQKGRRGLGLKPSTVGEVPRDFTWSPDESKPEAKEEVLWMPPPPDDTLSGDQLDEWLVRGPKKLTIDDETEFVDPQILKGVLESKTIFDTLDDEDLRHARFRSNPYETIASVIFLNRAAVKMANIDAVFDFMFTKPKKQNGESGIDKKEILYFADVCAGPGGFSEYVLYRKGWRSKGKYYIKI